MPTTSTRPFAEPAGSPGNGDLEHAVQSDPGSFRILTGDRPTGPLHIGHLFGTLENRVRLQRLGVELLVLIADYQTITDRVAPVQLPHDVEGLVADYLAVGIDPERAIIFTHSQVPELNQLILPFLSLISVAELGRNPTVKDEIAMTGGGSTSALMFTYPAHQAADILFCRANLVPVGKDQLPHLELTRTIARRFNERYSPDVPYFPEPEALLSRAPLLLGLDGRKMGKSRGNSIPLAASAGRDGASHQGREDRLGTADHVRARPPPRSLQPPRDRIAESRASARGDRGRDRRGGGRCAQAPRPRRDQRAPPADPRPARRAGQGPRVPASRPPARERTRERDRLDDARQRPGAHAHDVLTRDGGRAATFLGPTATRRRSVERGGNVIGHH